MIGRKMRLLDGHSRYNAIFRRDKEFRLKGGTYIVNHLGSGGLKPGLEARSSRLGELLGNRR